MLTVVLGPCVKYPAVEGVPAEKKIKKNDSSGMQGRVPQETERLPVCSYSWA